MSELATPFRGDTFPSTIDKCNSAGFWIVNSQLVPKCHKFHSVNNFCLSSHAALARAVGAPTIAVREPSRPRLPPPGAARVFGQPPPSRPDQQETFAAAFEKIRQGTAPIDCERDFLKYVFTIARRYAQESYRRHVTTEQCSLTRQETFDPKKHVVLAIGETA